MGRMAPWPAISAFQICSTSLPRGVNGPMPVMTIRREAAMCDPATSRFAPLGAPAAAPRGYRGYLRRPRSESGLGRRAVYRRFSGPPCHARELGNQGAHLSAEDEVMFTKD